MRRGEAKETRSGSNKKHKIGLSGGAKPSAGRRTAAEYRPDKGGRKARDKKMNINLGENIRALRKRRALTQERLAEAVGVTVGAVYKWEAGLTFPEIEKLVEIADFFDTSTDALLGYEARDNSRAETVARIKKCMANKNREGFAEAEKALRKYPNAFDVVYNCARLFLVFGIETKDAKTLERAEELFGRARTLIGQNGDPRTDDGIICGGIAKSMMYRGQAQRAVELLKKGNSGGRYCDLIGLTLAADLGRKEEAAPFLSEALIKTVKTQIITVMGFVNVYLGRKDYAAARDILRWNGAYLAGLRRDGKTCFTDKISATFGVLLAFSELKTGDEKAAREELAKAKKTAEEFDREPNYGTDALRFAEKCEEAGVYDDLGTTAFESIRKTLTAIDDKELSEIWERISKNE